MALVTALLVIGIACGIAAWFANECPLVAARCFGVNPDQAENEAQAELSRLVPRLDALLKKASDEPLADLDPRKYRQVHRRVTRTVAAV